MVYSNLEYVLANKTHKLLWDFEIKIDHLISTRRSDLVTVKKKKKKKKKRKREKVTNCGLRCFSRLQNKIKRMRKLRWMPRPYQRTKKKMEYEGDVYTNHNWYTWNNPQRIGKRTGGLRNKRTSGFHPYYSILKIGQNTEKSPGDLRRLAVTRTPLRNHQLMLMWKTLKSKIIMIIISLCTVLRFPLFYSILMIFKVFYLTHWRNS